MRATELKASICRETPESVHLLLQAAGYGTPTTAMALLSRGAPSATVTLTPVAATRTLASAPLQPHPCRVEAAAPDSRASIGGGGRADRGATGIAGAMRALRCVEARLLGALMLTTAGLGANAARNMDGKNTAPGPEPLTTSSSGPAGNTLTAAM